MRTTTTSPRPSDQELGLRPGWSADKPARTVLAALGHPGYGESFARRVLASMAAQPGLPVAQAVYGQRARA